MLFNLNIGMTEVGLPAGLFNLISISGDGKIVACVDSGSDTMAVVMGESKKDAVRTLDLKRMTRHFDFFYGSVKWIKLNSEGSIVWVGATQALFGIQLSGSDPFAPVNLVMRRAQQNQLQKFAASDDASVIACSEHLGDCVRIIDTENRSARAIQPSLTYEPKTFMLQKLLALSPDGKWLYAVSNQARRCIIDLNTDSTVWFEGVVESSDPGIIDQMIRFEIGYCVGNDGFISCSPCSSRLFFQKGEQGMWYSRPAQLIPDTVPKATFFPETSLALLKEASSISLYKLNVQNASVRFEKMMQIQTGAVDFDRTPCARWFAFLGALGQIGYGGQMVTIVDAGERNPLNGLPTPWWGRPPEEWGVEPVLIEAEET